MKPTHFAALCITLLFVGFASAADVRDVRFWRAPDHIRVVFDLTAPVSHEVISLSSPDRLVVDISTAEMKASTDALTFENSPIQRMRYAAKPDGKLRVVFDLSDAVQARSFFLPASAGLNDRLVVDFLDQQKENEPPKVVKSVSETPQRDVVIAIDAGARRRRPWCDWVPGRLREKDVVYKIAKKLEAKFKSKRGYQVVMIRDWRLLRRPGQAPRSGPQGPSRLLCVGACRCVHSSQCQWQFGLCAVSAWCH